MHAALQRAEGFARAYGLGVPVLMAPMAGASPPALAAAVANAGGMGAGGVLTLSPRAIADWVAAVRRTTNGSVQLNTWVPDPPPTRDQSHEAAVRGFLERFGPTVAAEAAGGPERDFAAQCAAMIAARPNVISSIMGLFPADTVSAMRAAGIAWFATATTVGEARAAVAAGADAVIAQGMEAGGHRGAFEAAAAGTALVGLFALVPAVADAVDVPVIAAGGVADGRTAAAALVLGASAVMIGTALLRAPEAAVAPAWAARLADTQPEDTVPTRAFSGRLGRALATTYVRAAAGADAPEPAPYPVQRRLTQAMRDAAGAEGDVERMQAWAGQAARLARAVPAATIVTELWDATRAELGHR